MFKQRSHETHHNTHVPEIKGHPGDYTVAILGDSLFERFKTTGKFVSAEPTDEMFKLRSHQTHHNTHVPQIKGNPGQYTTAVPDASGVERFETTGRMLSINKDSRILNLGVGGDKILNVQYRMDQGLVHLLKQHQPNIKTMYIHMGSNNLKKQGLRKGDVDAYGALIKQLRTEFPDMTIVITALFIQRGLGLDVIEQTNTTLKGIADEHGCEFLPFGDEQAGIMSEDNVHLNEFGYRKWNEILTNDMNSR
ncbi:SGNH hydrolase-type esterase domain-containing protein [Fusarium redolens]|uniref:SGNH hydrolase-type esterase domain-containing protein n=1 Tax=Fusarium redolens TaxID=48865 RepID=A0A9P9GIR4_FUSRE|nr:SGNH hydrolase-type esterase domain-containing protein [Fusarium redolens]KAH7240289.1 SGNH hydrolase-type esterase domain-containing protein [Fusarium redolens]